MNDRQSAPRIAAWWTLALLSVLLMVSFLDRTILALLVAPIKHDLGISDRSFALLYGASFALFFGIVGVPIARLVDRGRPKRIILAGVLIWSVATASCGFANSFTAMLILRMFLAIGEATLSPAAAAMIAAQFPLRRRVLAQTIYAAAGQIGSQGGLAIGGLMIAAAAAGADTNGQVFGRFHQWQAVLMMAAIPGFVLALLFSLTTRTMEHREDDPTYESLRQVRPFLAHLNANRRLYFGYLFGATGPSIVVYAYSAWLPEMLRRTFGMNIAEIGGWLGLVGIPMALGGTFVVPLIGNRLIRRRPDGLIITAMVCLSIGVLAAVATPLQPSFTAALTCYAVALFMLVGTINAILAGIQLIVPASAIGTMNSLALICITMVGLGIGPSAAAALAGAFAGPHTLNSALSLLPVLTVIPSIGLLMLARPLVGARIREMLERDRTASIQD